MSKRKKALGKGLKALLDDAGKDGDSNIRETYTSMLGSVSQIPLAQIEVNPFQPRADFDETRLEELAGSIKTHGVVQPVTVRRLTSKKYQLIAGERRVRAAKMAGLEAVPAFLRTADDHEMLEIALIENIQREDLNAIEVAINYQRLMEECDLTQGKLAERIGKQRVTITNYLRLLKLPPEIQAGIRDRALSMGHARALINLADADKQLYAYHQIVDGGLSVRKAEDLVRRLQIAEKNGTPSVREKKKLPVAYRNIQDKLTDHFETKVAVKLKKGGRGTIEIPFYDADDLERVLELLENQ